MDNDDDLQNRLDRIGQWRAFDIDWAHFCELAVLGIVDLCALSMGIHPEYARLVRGMTTLDLENIPKPEEIKALTAYRNDSIAEWERRVAVAVNHIKAGTLPVARNAEPFGGHDPFEVLPADAENIAVKVPDFVTWAIALPTPWELPEEMKRMRPYPEAEEGLQVGGGGDKTVGKRERDTLLTIIAAFCKYEGLDPKERGLAAKIAQMTQDLGAPVTDDTIRAVLAQIPDAVESRMK